MLLMEDAANNGIPQAQYSIGNAYRHGQGVEKNMALAIRWWTKAMESGQQRAAESLSQLRRQALSSDQPEQRLEVRMGTLGRLSARFRTARVKVTRRPCVTIRSKFGHLVGDLRFSGENAYSTLDDPRVRARLVVVDRRCANRTANRVGRTLASAGRWRGPSLLACGPTPRLAMLAMRDKYFGDFLAVQTDRIAAARITRIASAIRFADSFAYERSLQSATLRPEPPYFRGEARYSDGALSGDLEARFPGVGWTALSPGPATLYRSDPDPLPCMRVFGSLNRSVVSGSVGRSPATRLRSRLAPPSPSR